MNAPTRGISVILVAYHGDRWLPACLDALATATHRKVHLVLVDNDGNSGFETLRLDRFETEILETPHRMGFAEANNFGLTHAAHLEEHVLFLNQDTVSRTAWIDACLDCFDRSPSLGALSPAIRRYDFTGWDSGFADCVRGEGYAPDSLPNSSPEGWMEARFAPATALIVRTDVLRLVGPFDPVFGSYYEDYDLCRRIRNAGFDLGFCTGVEIGHFAGSSTTTRERELLRMRQVIRNRFIHRVREAGDRRMPLAARYFLADMPKNLARGLARTPSSQPPGVTLQAVADMVRIAGRLLSRRIDESRWIAYLAEIGWPPVNGREPLTGASRSAPPVDGEGAGGATR